MEFSGACELYLLHNMLSNICRLCSKTLAAAQGPSEMSWLSSWTYSTCATWCLQLPRSGVSCRRYRTQPALWLMPFSWYSCFSS